ncbi:hypothetical protein BDZ97DRAFT_1650119 [Flammula alnicola]|nr:hypothetical protein BDZ97DRAFT_1650119 [Flammula alnicola]
MATSAPTVPSTQSSQLCDYCHQKPKFSNHSYCSKTCAGQAAALCNHCHKKPKFQNFDYCGKNCAALANPGGKSRNAGPSASAPQYGAGSTQVNPNSNKQGAFDPVQLAKLVAQHIPQVQAMFAPSGNPAGQGAAPPAPQPIVTNPFANPVPQVVPPVTYNNAPLNNPFLNPGPLNQNAYQGAPAAAAQNPMTNGAVKLAASSNPLPAAQQLHLSTQQSATNIECLIPGCGKPVHADAKEVKTSDYCSMRHREEAVATGLASPCIMCLTLPQSDTDYFCSRECREESLNKHMDYDESSE